MKRTGAGIFVLGFFLIFQAAQAGWTTAKRLTWTSGYSIVPACAVGPSEKLHLVWEDNTAGNTEIYYKRSTDGGGTWSASQRLTWNSADSERPSIAVDPSGNVHVVWGDATPGNAEIYYRKSTDGGATWSTAKRLTWTSGGSWAPVIAVDSSGDLDVVWYDLTPGNTEIYYKKSTDGGGTWSTSQRITWSAGNSYLPDIAAAPSGPLHVVWYDDTPGNGEVYYKKSTNGGAAWSTSQRLTWTAGWPDLAVIAVAPSGSLHVIWDDDISTQCEYEIFHKKSTNGGASWSTGQRLTWTSGLSAYPDVAVDSLSRLHVVWCNEAPGNYEIYYKKSTNGGSVWSTGQRLTWTSGSSEGPAVVVDASNHLHVVWQDNTPGNYEIYYLKSN
jgi:hypothetical protein